MTTEARTILGPAAAALAQAGIDSALQDARLLLGLALGRDDAVLPHEDINSWTNDIPEFGSIRRCRYRNR